MLLSFEDGNGSGGCNERLNTMEVCQINYETETDEHFERVFEHISEHEESSQKVFCFRGLAHAFSRHIAVLDGAAGIACPC